MRLGDYIAGLKFNLVSPLSPDEVAERIREQASSLFNPFASGVSAWSRLGFVRLRWSTPMFSNGFAPVFSGRLSEDMGRTRLRASYGASLYLKCFLTFWFGIISLFLLVGVVAILGDGPKTGDEYILFIAIIPFIAAPFVFHFLGNRNAMLHLERMLDFLEREAKLTRDDSYPS